MNIAKRSAWLRRGGLFLALFATLATALAFRGTNQDDQHDRDARRAAFHGTKEFTQSGTFVVPDDVTTILVDIYGGGGGGGGVDADFGGFGGSGGAGAFSRGVIRVMPGSTLTVTIGQGGAGGLNIVGAPTDGSDGGDTSVSLNGFPMITGYGGKGGKSTLDGRAGGQGGAVDPTAMISHAGQNGKDSPFDTLGTPGSGYQPASLFVSGPSGSVSAGGSSRGITEYVTSPGQPGYVLLTY